MSWQVVALILGLVGETLVFLANLAWSGAYERVRNERKVDHDVKSISRAQ